MSSENDAKRRRRGRKSAEGKHVGETQQAEKLAGGEDESKEVNVQAHKSLLLQLEGETWYNYAKTLPGWNATIESAASVDGTKQISNTPSVVAKYRAMADLIYQKEIELFSKNAPRGSDERWVESTMKRGTLKDRIAAMSVTVSADPVHKFHVLDGLLHMAGCSAEGASGGGGGAAGQTNSRVAQMTAEALEDLFLNTFLLSDRKLISMDQRPLSRYENTAQDGGGNKKKATQKTLSPRILLLWRFEERIKEKYSLFLRRYMAQTLHEGVETHKIATLRLAATMLRSVAEGESQLLSMMVNKLGDPVKKAASAAGHELRRVLRQHPAMQIVIAREVQQLSHRPHLSSRAQYNCIVFLNQLKLDKEDEESDKKKNPKSSSSSAGRGSDTSLAASLIKTYFRFFEVAVTNTKVKKGKSDSPSSDDAGIKSRLLSALLTGINRAHPYLPEKDKDIEEHLDALYRVVHTAAPSASTQALMLLFHVTVGSKIEGDERNYDEDAVERSKVSPNLASRQDRFYRALYASLSSNQSMLSPGKHLTMYFNLLYKAMKYDKDVTRVNAFGKRIFCSALHCCPPVLSGSLFLLNEITKSQPELKQCFTDTPGEKDSKLILDTTKRDPRAALVYDEQSQTSGDNSSEDSPKYPPFWELSLASNHFHPSVAKFANTFGEIEYMGDPLKDFALTPFLDKFAYRNPKSSQKLSTHFKRGETVAERRSGREGTMLARMSTPVNDPSFLKQEDVNEQDEFFHKFFVERARRDEIKGIVRHKPSTDGDDNAGDDVFDEAVEAAEGALDPDSQKSFEEYEQAWETDEEEEAFVDSLAQKLMEDAADGQLDSDDDLDDDDSENGAADLDDEDPDMGDWGDLRGRDDDNADGDVGGDDDEIDSDMDDVDVDDDDDDNSNSDDDDAFMDDDGSSDDQDDLEESDIFGGGAQDDDHDSGDLAFVGNSSSDEDEDDGRAKGKKKSKKKNKPELATFAGAEEYAAMISNGWNDLGRSDTSSKDAIPEIEEDDEDEKPSGTKSKKNKRKRKSK